MFWGLSVLLLSYAGFCVAPAPVSKRGEERCGAAEVYEGESTNITCYFGEGIDPSQHTFVLDRYTPDSRNETGPPTVIECFTQEASRSYCIQHHNQSFRLRNVERLTDPVVVDVFNATKSMSGEYVCALLRRKPLAPINVSCQLEVKAAKTRQNSATSLSSEERLDKNGQQKNDSETDSTDVSLYVIGGVALLLILLSVALGVNICRRRRRRRAGKYEVSPGSQDRKMAISLPDMINVDIANTTVCSSQPFLGDECEKNDEQQA